MRWRKWRNKNSAWQNVGDAERRLPSAKLDARQQDDSPCGAGNRPASDSLRLVGGQCRARGVVTSESGSADPDSLCGDQIGMQQKSS